MSVGIDRCMDALSCSEAKERGDRKKRCRPFKKGIFQHIGFFSRLISAKERPSIGPRREQWDNDSHKLQHAPVMRA